MQVDESKKRQWRSRLVLLLIGAMFFGSVGKLGVTGTPSWVVGDQVISGMVPYEVLKQAVEAARRKGK